MFDVKRKNRVKVIRTVLESLFLLLVLFIIIRALFSFREYEPFDDSLRTSEKGFVAVSYFGVDLEGTSTLISTERLNEHLSALKKQGYVTISQQDIMDYYEQGKELPEKALFIMFEDGRRDTAIFAQKILEDFNFRGNILTYADKLIDGTDPKFLSGRDINDLLATSWWETGSNGFRLYYINAYDRYKYYIGELTALEFEEMAGKLGRDYNHYLMDYIRDEDMLPEESYSEMKARINDDYTGMKRVYETEFGSVPGLYAIMHANTGHFGNNTRVSNVNAENIYSIFKMNFNREGFCFNTAGGAEHEIYDLTRMQPQSYWYSNHLLMRVKYDGEEEIAFINGNDSTYRKWNVKSGALECKPEKLVVTSVPGNYGEVQLGTVCSPDIEISTRLTGNVFGTQTVFLSGDASSGSGVGISLKNNHLLIEENGSTLFDLDLDEFDGKKKISVEEDMKEARITELSAMLRYAGDASEALAFREALDEIKEMPVKTVEEGAEEYIEEIPIGRLGNREMKIISEGETISVYIDNKIAADHIRVTPRNETCVSLKSIWGGYGWSQRNIADDVYDGCFEDLIISDLSGNNVFYDDTLHGLELLKETGKQICRNVINWFIKNL